MQVSHPLAATDISTDIRFIGYASFLLGSAHEHSRKPDDQVAYIWILDAIWTGPVLTSLNSISVEGTLLMVRNWTDRATRTKLKHYITVIYFMRFGDVLVMYLLQKPPTEPPSEIRFDFSHLSTKSDKNTRKLHEPSDSEKTTIQSVQHALYWQQQCMLDWLDVQDQQGCTVIKEFIHDCII